MPQIAITLAEGRTPEQLRAMMHEVHAAVLRTAHTRPEHIRVVVHEVPRRNWATGDVTLAEMDAAGTETDAPGTETTTAGASQGAAPAGNDSDRDATRRPVTSPDEDQL